MKLLSSSKIYIKIPIPHKQLLHLMKH